MSYFKNPSESQLLVWNDRFQAKDKTNSSIESTIEDTLYRVAENLAKPEKDALYSDRFFDMMNNGLFIPAGRILSNIGTNNNNGFNCYVIPVKDDLASIFDSMKEMALIQQRGGGTGFNFSELRPSGEYASTSHSHASGPCSFISAFNKSSDVIRSGSRRAANMGILSVYHPDIRDFISHKRINPGDWERFNVSVAIDSKFIEAVRNDKEIELSFKGRVYETVKAKEIWNLICQEAWAYGDPGIIDLEMANQDFEYESFIGQKVKACNPCSEQILHDYDQCCLGSINLVTMLDNPLSNKPSFNTERFRETIRLANRMLDNVYDVSTYPLPQNREFGMKYRRVGIGLMGFADMCYLMGIKYSQSDVVANQIMEQMVEYAFESSCDLAKEKGKNSIDPDKYIKSAFIGRNLSKRLVEDIKTHGIRNMNVLSIAPTGTISMFAGVSSGIEPVFAHSFMRKDALTETSREIDHPIYGECKKKSNFEELNKEKVFQTAHDISPEEHVHIHGQFASYIDSSISKTTNLPHDATVEDVSRVFLMAREYGIKSTTVYRDGSRNQVLTPKDSKFCPECSAELQSDQNCKSCPSCGWSVCSI